MIIKFQSEDSGEFVMLSHVAEPLLKMMGTSGGNEGAVSGDNLSTALSRLEASLQLRAEPAEDGADEEDEEVETPVALSTRATPLLQMLRTAAENDGYVMWRPE